MRWICMMECCQTKRNIKPTAKEDAPHDVLLSACVGRCTAVGYVFRLGVVCSLSFGDQQPPANMNFNAGFVPESIGV